MGAGQLRRAIEREEVNYVTFAGLKRISDAEIERIAALLGISILEPEPATKPAQLKKPAKKRSASTAADVHA